MHEGEFISILTFGAMLGSAFTLLIQYYGRRKVRAAMKTGGVTPSRQNELLSTENEAMRGSKSGYR